MTRERIQKNTNKYTVKNCPCYWYIGGDEGCDLDNTKACEDTTDCVIKQIITICKVNKMSKEDMKRSKEFVDIIRGSKYGRDALAIQILQLFDIEEVK